MRQKGPIMNPNFRFQVLPQSTLPYQNKYNVMNEKMIVNGRHLIGGFVLQAEFSEILKVKTKNQNGVKP